MNTKHDKSYGTVVRFSTTDADEEKAADRNETDNKNNIDNDKKWYLERIFDNILTRNFSINRYRILCVLIVCFTIAFLATNLSLPLFFGWSFYATLSSSIPIGKDLACEKEARWWLFVLVRFFFFVFFIILFLIFN